jgi:hypothetical protein
MKTTITQDQWIRIGKTAGWLPLEKNAGLFDIFKSPQAKALNDKYRTNPNDAIMEVTNTQSENMLLAAIKHKDKKIQAAAANNPAASEAVLMNAVKKGQSYGVVRAALQNQKVTPEIVAAAFNNKHYELAVRHKQAPESILLQALDFTNKSDDGVYVASAAAGNEAATKDVLLKAVTNRNARVRDTALANKKADYDVKYWYVWNFYVVHGQLDLTLLLKDTQMFDNLITDVSQKTPRLLPRLFQDIQLMSAEDARAPGFKDKASERILSLMGSQR